MPLTFAHPIAVVPLARRGLVFSALVVGSMAPDFEYFLRLSTRHSFGHTLPGLFLFSVPAGLVGLWIFHALLKLPLLSLLPESHQRRLLPLAREEFRFGPARRLGLILLSLLLGAVTHVAWDSMTHPEGWTVVHVPWLGRVIGRTPVGELFVCRVLQHMSTAFGLAGLAWGYGRWLRRAAVVELPVPARFSGRTKIRLLFYAGFIAAVLASLFGYWDNHSKWEADTLVMFVSRAVVAGVSAVFLELVGFGLWWRWGQGQAPDKGRAG